MDIWQPLPSVIFGTFAIMSGCLSFLLPETVHTKMPDTIAEAEEIGKSVLHKVTDTSHLLQNIEDLVCDILSKNKWHVIRDV